MELKVARQKKIIEWSEDDKVFVAKAPDLPGCVTHGKTEEEALENLNEAIELYLESSIGDELDQVEGQKKFLVRMPARQHLLLTKLAQEHDKSMNDLILEYLNFGIKLVWGGKTASGVVNAKAIREIESKRRSNRAEAKLLESIFGKKRETKPASKKKISRAGFKKPEHHTTKKRDQ